MHTQNIWNSMTASVLKQGPNTKKVQPNAYLTRKRSMDIFREILLITPQNDT